MTVEEINRRHFIGRLSGVMIGAGAGFAASFPAAKSTRSLRGAEFPKQKNLVNARAERQNHQLILDFLSFERESNNRPPRMSQKEFRSYLGKQKELGEDAVESASLCFRTLAGKDMDEQEFVKFLSQQVASYDRAIEDLEQQSKSHLESQDLAFGDWSISLALTGLLGLGGWFLGTRIDTGLDESDEKRAHQAMIDSRK